MCIFYVSKEISTPGVRRVLLMRSVIDANPSVSAMLPVYLHKLGISDSLICHTSIFVCLVFTACF